MNPIQTPHHVCGEVKGRLPPIAIYVVAHLLDALRDFRSGRRLVRCSGYVNRTGTVIGRTRVYILNSQPLKALERAWPQPESSTRLVNEPQHLVKLMKAVPGFQSGLLFGISV
jgi:hypothetical protein